MNNTVIVYILSKKSIDLKKSQKQSSPATKRISVNMNDLLMSE